ncbi:carboxymuconolactone decarboxylase family protein [Vibrio vulnificus]
MNYEDNQCLSLGLEVIANLELPMGNEHGVLHGMRLQAPGFKSHLIESLGKHFSPDQPIDDKTKVLLALTLVTANQSGGDLVEFFTGAAIKQGWRREQIVAALELGALFHGWPAAVNSVQTVMATFDKLDAINEGSEHGR